MHIVHSSYLWYLLVYTFDNDRRKDVISFIHHKENVFNPVADEIQGSVQENNTTFQVTLVKQVQNYLPYGFYIVFHQPIVE